MQTFLPYPSFERSAKVLDDEQLLTQCNDVVTILEVLHEINLDREDMGEDWLDHPAIKMWKTYEPQLCLYGLAMCTELQSRTGSYMNLVDVITWHFVCATGGEHESGLPPWFGNPDFHLSHRSYLMSKDYAHYSLYFDVDTPVNIPTFWPV